MKSEQFVFRFPFNARPHVRRFGCCPAYPFRLTERHPGISRPSGERGSVRSKVRVVLASVYQPRTPRLEAGVAPRSSSRMLKPKNSVVAVVAKLRPFSRSL